ncbi:MAG: hypothetical protein MZV64_71705 [Ignavibacteriales bacterium]|nr:hypothetical protein [Ignavibacteriales bacterium]
MTFAALGVSLARIPRRAKPPTSSSLPWRVNSSARVTMSKGNPFLAKLRDSAQRSAGDPGGKNPLP